jgi:D-alanine transaminase
MPRIAYVNGQYVPHSQAAVSIEDRGYQFSDGVYEVVAVMDGTIVDMAPHMARLKTSLQSLNIDMPMSDAALGLVMRQLIRRNRLSYGILYLQITRGVAPRDHAFPVDLPPSLVMTCRSVPASVAVAKARDGVSVRTLSEERWARPDIKSISLLPNVLAKQAAREAGDYEAWFVDKDGNVTEGSSTNAWMVTKDGRLVTRPLSTAILPGVVRAIVFELAAQLGLDIEERVFSVEEALSAKEAFVTSTSGVMPVVAIDGKTVANGAPGDVTTTLIAAYRQHLANQTDDAAATLQILSEPS